MPIINDPPSTTIGGITSACFHIAGVTCPNCAPFVRKSSACPYCTPRCPHGYPADVAPSYPAPFYPVTPWITITSVTNDAGTFPVNGGSTVMNMSYDLNANPNVNFTYTSH